MNDTHPQSGRGRARAWRTLLVVAALCAATLTPGGTTAQDPAISDVLLAAPTGARAGAPVLAGAAAPDATAITPFDTFGRDPALAVYTLATDEGEGWAAWQVTAVPAADPTAEPMSLATGVAEVPIDRVDLAPPPPGDWLVTAVLTAGQAGPDGTWVWHLLIPDRSLPAFLPAPDVVLFGGGASVIAARGSGCYVGQCGDIGRLPPDPDLPLIRLERADEPITLTLSDGSTLVQVRVAAMLLNVDETSPVTLLEASLEPGTHVVLVPAPPSLGRWRLEVSLVFSDARGDQVGYARVAVPNA